jgi:uncharacterized membrane protein YeaQ/YmgE (transglycosylase-associated protein family)
MEFLRHPLYSILAVILIGVACAWATHRLRYRRARPPLATAILAGIGAAFVGFHVAMLSNLMTNVILMPFIVALVVALLASVALVRT